MKRAYLVLAAALLASPFLCQAEDDNLTLDAAVGGAIGGAVGGAIGAELGGRQGAIVGAGVGAATGTAINTREYVESEQHRDYYHRDDDRHYDRERHHDHAPADGRFCPPGQAKKGRC